METLRFTIATADRQPETMRAIELGRRPWRILNALQDGPLGITEVYAAARKSLAHSAKRENGATKARLREMERHGLVERASLIFITEAGRDALCATAQGRRAA